MSLHIKSFKSNRIKLFDLVESLIFSLGIEVKSLNLNQKKILLPEAKKLFRYLIEEGKSFRLDFFIKIKKKNGFIQIYDAYDHKIFGDIEVDIFEGKFIELLDDSNFKEKLDRFCESQKEYINKLFIDINEEGDEDPLDVLYEYDSRGRTLFLKLMKALEEFSEESNEYEMLYNKVRESDKNFLASKLWQDNKIRNYAFSLAEGKGVVAQEGSLKIYAKNQKELKQFYEAMIKEIIKPIYDDIPSVEQRISNVSKSLL